jgi:hypothetical protein
MDTIGPNTLVTPQVLEELRFKLGLTVTDFCWLFGLSMPTWSLVRSQANEDPINDPAVALLARWLDKFPHLCPVPKSMKPEEAYQIINSVRPITKKEFGVALGREASAGYRWIKLNGSVPPVLDRILYILIGQIDYAQEEGDQEEAERLLSEWMRMTENEARLRGVHNIWQSGNWNKKPKPRRPSAEEAEKPMKARRPSDRGAGADA